ncbi:type II toxin-antitoxin system VapC family toxin [Rubrobacter taiwanensis]|uniref:type II toxin-antitoxin system VapC family toxin n=1 Tax=Rubrobacter taiwanensis TaxID=185139 RepID=UPI001A9F2634|nr:type II toxin-antitoxin system VapC family toxin [Rubrobacter taiwanensis]
MSAPEKRVVDSSGWIEYFADGPNADFFSEAIEDTSALVVPTISLYEVFKRLLREPGGEDDALQVVAVMQRGLVVDLDAELSLEAARTAYDLGLPMADSVILATARRHRAILLTQDSDFKDIPGVRYVEKKRG